MNLNRRGLLAGLLACPVCAGLARAEGAHWAYEGHGGADEWGKLDSKFQACAVGAEQSPIDLKKATKADIGTLQIGWTPEANKIVNNGHTIQLNVAGASTAQLDGEAFVLKQYHFHTPSEHALSGARTDMEVHFVHANAAGKLAVVGVFMKAGAAHKGFSAIMAAAPKAEGEAALAAAIDPKSFLPKTKARFRYEGSLTTPPCSEIVDWNVFEQPVEVAESDIRAFVNLFPMNARPLQAIGRRFLLKGV
ncbi:carbonic anhydrase [Rhodoblastus acidophilus]|uniref:carbonic anhydrase n=1 Tax=Rhodoblastus acidophilus TaxID=1074 RepID=UPI002223FC55|nr:carbonic anhydrase family protein [Rhodoblastus acidophilus]MCW2316554.1 carbonic anhydrase [Rhodoblastus acidophilus]